MELNNDKLPDSVFGEWYDEDGGGEYDGTLIHPDFIEYVYRPFTYQYIKEAENGQFAFEAVDKKGDTLHYKLEVLAEDTIKLKRDDYDWRLLTKHDDPIDSKRVSMEDVPDELKKTWFTTDGENTKEFKVNAEEITFRGKSYEIEEVVHFDPHADEQYRFIVKNEEDYWMFYFKNWDDYYLKVGFEGEAGDLYKADKDYPDHRLNDMEAYLSSDFPKELRGDWLKADGSNLWAFSFYYDQAVLDKEIWDYKSVEEEEGLYKITLTHNDKEKVLYAEPQKGKKAGFGKHKDDLKTYTTALVNTPDYRPTDDHPYDKEDIFKAVSATYSGIIKGFDPENDDKTGVVHVDNIFTGNQDSYMVRIEDDGRFTVNIPAYYPQKILVRLPDYYSAVYVEPGKETWQLINEAQEVFFAGDLAQFNTDLKSLDFILSDERAAFIKNKKAKNGAYSSKESKEESHALYDRQKKMLDSVLDKRFISKKAEQVAGLNIKYDFYLINLDDGLDMTQGTPQIDSTYIGFLTPEVYGDKLAILAGAYNSFINRLKIITHMLGKNRTVSIPTEIIELVALLKENDVKLSQEEQKLVALEENYKKENASALKKEKQFREDNKEILESLLTKESKLGQEVNRKELKKIVEGDSFDFALAESHIKSKDLAIHFTDQEKSVRRKQQNLLNEEEQKRFDAFYSDRNNKKRQEFFQKHSGVIHSYIQSERIEQEKINIQDQLGKTFSADIIIVQTILDQMFEDHNPFSDKELKQAQAGINDHFIADIIQFENEKFKSKIQTNSSKTEYTTHETPEGKSDNIFEDIMSEYEGKLVFVDFWATWCGPCISGIRSMKTMKESLKDKDVVFVYITNPSSPKKTYENMIPNISGEHYRVSQDEWNYLSDRFNIGGIPHYLLVDQKGSVLKDNTSDLGRPQSLKRLIKSELTES